MRVLCEMFVKHFFRLSSGHIAIVGSLVPNINSFIPPNSRADLYLSGKKIKTINIIGEDRFSGVDESIRQQKRSIRTDSEIPKEFNLQSNAKLVIYE